MRPIPALLSVLLLTACTAFPTLEETIDPAVAEQPFPELKPQQDLLATANDGATDQALLRETLTEQSADLAARAEAARSGDDAEDDLAERGARLRRNAETARTRAAQDLQ